MTNVQLILFVGVLLGWGMTAVDRNFRAAMAARNSVAGGLGGFAGALIAHGGTLYGALTGATWGGAVAGALIAAGLAGLIPLPRMR